MNFQENIKVLWEYIGDIRKKKKEHWDGDLHISLSIYEMDLILSALPLSYRVIVKII